MEALLTIEDQLEALLSIEDLSKLFYPLKTCGRTPSPVEGLLTIETCGRSSIHRKLVEVLLTIEDLWKA